MACDWLPKNTMPLLSSSGVAICLTLDRAAISSTGSKKTRTLFERINRPVSRRFDVVHGLQPSRLYHLCLVDQFVVMLPTMPSRDSGDLERLPRVHGIVVQALTLADTDRAAFLDQACGTDSRLRRDVETLLAAPDPLTPSDPTAVAADTIGGIPTVKVPSVAGPDSPIRPGQTVSHYRITGKIGEGGMGAVYKAIDTNLGRPVALKLISRSSISENDKRRFAREAKAASTLNHPNIVTIYEYNSENGLDFIAMEFVEGIPLNQVLKQGESPISTLLEYARQVAAGVAKAHAAGIAHRDLKPANIMITVDGTAKVLDFGLAKHGCEAEGTEGEATEALTQEGAVVGTPAYMSPEQAMGEPADFRSDIFSFGIILYEMVCGRRPFQGVDAQTTMRQIVNKDPQPAAEVNPSLPRNLAALIEACLRKDKEQRLQSMGEAVERLRPAANPEASPWGRFPKWAVWAAAGLAITAGGIRWGPSLHIPDFFPQQRKTASVSETTAIDPAWSARELAQQARGLLQNYHKPASFDRAQEMLELAIRKDPTYAAAHAGLSDLFTLRDNAARDPQWQKLAEQYARKAVELEPQLASAHLALGAVEVKKGHRDLALAEFQRAADLDPRNGTVQLALAKVYVARSEDALVQQHFQKALQFSPDSWIVNAEFGIYHYQNARYEEAAKVLERARELSPDNVVVLRNLSSAHTMLGRFEEAAALVQRGLELRPSPALYSKLGYIRFFQGRYLDAVPPMEKAVELHPQNQIYWGNLGDAYRWTPGNQQKAKEAFSRAAQLARELLAKTPDDSEVRGSLAVFLAKQGDLDAARQELGNLEKIKKKTPGSLFKFLLASEIAGNRDQAIAALPDLLRTGYPIREIENDPDLVAFRRDLRYHRLLANRAGK